jgi:metallo-beta-lactamase family protein
VKMYGKYVPVRAHVQNLSMLSAHADQGELLRWAGGFKKPPRSTFVVHGEPQSADTLRRVLAEKLGWNCGVAELGQKIALT